jgi:hypothetical protein
VDKISGKPITTNVSTVFSKSAEGTLFLNWKVKFLFGAWIIRDGENPMYSNTRSVDFTVYNRVNLFEVCNNKT